jgi:transposase
MVFMPSPYPKEFREGALALVRQGDRSVASIAKELGIAESGLRRWVEQDRRDRGEREGLTTDERDELRALRRENARLRQEKEILRKAAAFFAREEIR